MPRLLVAAVPAAAALAALLRGPACGDVPPAAPRRAPSDAEPPTPGLTPHLVIHRKMGARIHRVEDGASARPGDIVQVSYVAAGNEHGVVLSLDGAGEVTLHHPLAATDPPLLRMRGEQPLPLAFELDRAPEFERFVLVTSGDAPTDVGLVLDAARRLTAAGPGAARAEPLPLPSTWRQASLLLHKVP